MDDAPYIRDLDLESATTAEKLTELLRVVHARADNPSLRTLEAKTRHGPTPLTKTTISEMLSGTRFPRRAVMVAFLQACEVRDEDIEPWRRAWERIAAPVPGPAQRKVARVVPVEQTQPPTRTGVGGSRPETAGHHPTARRRELGVLLRALRNDKGLTIEQAAERLLSAPSRVESLETGHGIATPRDVRDLCDLYDVTDKADRERMMQLAFEGKQTGWWQSYKPDFDAYVAQEADAMTIRCFQCTSVPELLQTADYARAMLEAYRPKLSPWRIDERVGVKLDRQGILSRGNPPHLRAVLDEAVLHRAVGSASIMAAQLNQLIGVARHPNISVQVIGYQDGAYPAMDRAFSILDFAVSVPSVVYLEGLMGWVYIERPADLNRYHEVFESLADQALDLERSIELMTEIAKEHEH